MFGPMLKRYRHAAVIFGVMLTLSVGTIVWAVYWDTLQPNPGLTAHAADTRTRFRTRPRRAASADVAVPAVAGLPVDQSLGNLEGKELRFGTSAGRDLRGADDEHLERLGQLHARQPQSAGRPRRRWPACGSTASSAAWASA